jgi:Flp pilus assembly protein TadD
MKHKSNKMTGRVDFQEKREKAMRPSRYLGYDHDRLGAYFLDKEANALAEAEFRRAVWLNPYESNFQVHLAMCLFQQRKYAEAKGVIQQVLEITPQSQDAVDMLRLLDSRLAQTGRNG